MFHLFSVLVYVIFMDSQISKFSSSIAERIEKLNNYQPIFNAEIGGALKWVMRTQNMRLENLSNRIGGVSNSSWRSYTQMSYTKNRPLHVIASFSWLTQVTMLAIFKGNNIHKFWPTVSDETIQSIVRSGLLPEEQFEFLIRMIVSKVENRGYDVRDKVITLLAKIPKFDDSFLMPNQLDIDDFKRDYYQSIAKQLQLFRENNNISIELMAAILDEPVARVEAFEAPEKATTIPVFAAVRLKLGFDVADTVTFTSGMQTYHNFYLSRKVQQAREQIIIVLLQPLSIKDRKSVSNLIQAILMV